MTTPPSMPAHRHPFNRWHFESILIFLPLAIMITLLPVLIFSLFFQDHFVVFAVGVLLAILVLSIILSSVAALCRMRRDQSH